MTKSTISERRTRLEHVNQLVKIISDHGRRFFYDEQRNRIAQMELTARGRLWWIDDYTGKRLYLHPTPLAPTVLSSRYFSHGGTLRTLVLAMAEYVKTGKQLGRGVIRSDAILRAWDLCPDAGWIKVRNGMYYGWGYDDASLQAVRDAAYVLPIFEHYEAEIERNRIYAWHSAELAAAA